MNHTQWLEERKKGLGGSDAAAVLGLSPWKSDIELWLEKTGQKSPEDISEKEPVIYGKNAEGALRRLFKLDHPEYTIIFKRYDIAKHPKYPFLIASVDSDLIRKENQARGVLELKTTTIRRYADLEKWADRIPEYYLAQILHYINVKNAAFVWLRVLIKFDEEACGKRPSEIRDYYFYAEDYKDQIEYLQKEELRFWRHVENKTVPAHKMPLI